MPKLCFTALLFVGAFAGSWMMGIVKTANPVWIFVWAA
jgi:hypothetical protein